MSRGIPLTRGYVAIVDDEDFDWLNQWKWCFHSGGYAKRGSPDGKTILMHREICAATAAQYVDHIDGNKLNNLRGNLRACSPGESICNRRKLGNNSSGYIGVSFHKRFDAYYASVKVGRKPHFVGYFPSAEAAGRARDVKARELHGAFAVLNFPDKAA